MPGLRKIDPPQGVTGSNVKTNASFTTTSNVGNVKRQIFSNTNQTPAQEETTVSFIQYLHELTSSKEIVTPKKSSVLAPAPQNEVEKSST